MQNSSEKPKLLIVDDHAIIRRGLKFILESNFNIHEFQETESCKGLRTMLTTQKFSHLILDMQLTDGNVIEMLNEIIETYPTMSILVYTMSPEEIFGSRIMNMGVSGFLNKQADEKEVIVALTNFLPVKNIAVPPLKN